MRRVSLLVTMLCLGAPFATAQQVRPPGTDTFESPVALNIPDPSPDEDRVGPMEETIEDSAPLGYSIVTADGQIRHVAADPGWATALSLDGADRLEEPAPAPGARDLTEQSIKSDLPNGAPIVRVADADMADPPYRLTGRFALGCTGTMIGPRQIITAAHCVYNYKSRKYHSPKSLRFLLGRHGRFAKGRLLELDRIYAPDGYTAEHRATSDYAVVITKQTIEPALGRMAFGVAGEDVPFDTTRIHINGYPAGRSFRMFHTHCLGKPYAQRRMLYPCDTFGGMSGSSVYMLYPDGRRVIYAVHSGPWSSQYNRAVRLTAPIFLQIRDWKRKHD